MTSPAFNAILATLAGGGVPAITALSPRAKALAHADPFGPDSAAQLTEDDMRAMRDASLASVQVVSGGGLPSGVGRARHRRHGPRGAGRVGASGGAMTSPAETRIREALDAAGVHGGSITRGWAATTPKRERYGWWLVINGRWDWLGRTETEALARIGLGEVRP